MLRSDSPLPQSSLGGRNLDGSSYLYSLSVTEQLYLQVFERSSFRNEAGAAISLTPNGARLLHRWGFDPEKARGIANIQVGHF
jgi:hypothetical protein